MDWKYIMFEANGAKVPVIFPPSIIHSSMAEGIQHAVRRSVIEERPHNWSSKPVSAGFIGGLIATSTYGDSESLNGLAAQDGDRAVINTWPYAHGRDDGIPVSEAMIFEAVRRTMP